MKIKGTLTLRYGSQEIADDKPDAEQAFILLEIEQYLNSTVASEIFKQFKYGFRVHLTT